MKYINKKIKEAFVIYGKQEAENTPEKDYAYSEPFQAKMDSLINKSKKKRQVRLVLRRVAAVAVCLILVFSWLSIKMITTINVPTVVGRINTVPQREINYDNGEACGVYKSAYPETIELDKIENPYFYRIIYTNDKYYIYVFRDHWMEGYTEMCDGGWYEIDYGKNKLIDNEIDKLEGIDLINSDLFYNKYNYDKESGYYIKYLYDDNPKSSLEIWRENDNEEDVIYYSSINYSGNYSLIAATDDYFVLHSYYNDRTYVIEYKTGNKSELGNFPPYSAIGIIGEDYYYYNEDLFCRINLNTLETEKLECNLGDICQSYIIGKYIVIDCCNLYDENIESYLIVYDTETDQMYYPNIKGDDNNTYKIRNIDGDRIYYTTNTQTSFLTTKEEGGQDNKYYNYTGEFYMHDMSEKKSYKIASSDMPVDSIIINDDSFCILFGGYTLGKDKQLTYATGEVVYGKLPKSN